MCTYSVVAKNGEILANGRLLSELIEHVVFLQIKKIEQHSNVLTRLDRNLYKYLNQLSCFYNLSDMHADLIEQDWSYIDNFLNIYNQACYISKQEFIEIKIREEMGINE